MRKLGPWILRAGRAAPAVVTPTVKARSIGAFFLVGGIMAITVAALMSESTPGSRLIVGLVAGAGVILGLGILVLAEHVSRRAHTWLAAIATTFVTFAVVMATDHHAAITITTL